MKYIVTPANATHPVEQKAVGFGVFSLTLGTITHDVEALVVPFLGLYSVPLDYSAMFSY